MNVPNTADVVKKLRAGQAPPVSAMRVLGAPVELASEGNSADAKTIKVNLKARQRGPIDHPWWGRIWHDLSTMRSKPKIALDDTHDVEIGHGRPFQSEYGLEVDGVIVTNPDNPQHASNRIAYNLRNGIPQEASIDFSGEYDVKEVCEGATMQINGQDAAGPCLVVQNWPLRACAICKEGADSSTETNALTSGSALAPLPRTLTTFSNQTETTMSEQTLAEPVVETQVETVEAPPTQQAEAAPVVPVVEAPPVVTSETQPAPVDALADAVREIEQLKAQLGIVTAARDELAVANDSLTQRIAGLSAGVAPVPNASEAAPALDNPKTWAAAVERVGKERPQFALWQCHAEAARRWPNLLATTNTRS